MHIETGDWDGAINAFEYAYSVHSNTEALYRLLFLQHFACNFTRREDLLDSARRRVVLEVGSKNGTSMTPSQGLMMLDAPELRVLASVYAEGHAVAAREAAKPLGPWLWDLNTFVVQRQDVQAHWGYMPQHLISYDGRLRIGYISKDLGFSSVGQLLPRLLSAHDRRRLNVVVYCLNEDDGTDTFQELKSSPETWVDLHHAESMEIAEKINFDGINIVIDLGGHFGVKSQVALALQPAPLALNYLSWLSTTTAPYIQYFVSDSIVTPVDYAEADFTESLAFLPRSYQINSNRYSFGRQHYNPKARYTLLHPPHQQAIPPGAEFNDDAVIFSNFNQLFKIGPETFSAWMQILRATPNSVMSMLNITGAPAGSTRMFQSAEAAGVSKDRLLFSPFCTSKSDFLTLSGGAELFLDNTFYNAGTTGSDALYVGLPVLTSPGRRTLARMGASLAAALDFTTMIARSTDDYIELGIRVGRNRKQLARLRSQLNRQLKRGSLFDADRWVHSFEVMLYSIWDAALADSLSTGAGDFQKARRVVVAEG